VGQIGLKKPPAFRSRQTNENVPKHKPGASPLALVRRMFGGNKNTMKTPISYYGGKQQLLPTILPLIPDHKIYIEPFAGGASVFWAKEPAHVEVLNDLNGEVYNFYKVVQTKFDKLKRLINATPHSREAYADALHIYKRPGMFSKVKRAWAFYITTQQGYLKKIGSWGFAKKDPRFTRAYNNNKLRFDNRVLERLSNVQLEYKNAIDVIKGRDSIDAFIYIDPPYVGSYCGHYTGYTQEDFNQLIELLGNCQAKFLLSSYPNEHLNKAIKEYGWYHRKKDMPLASKKGSRKTECFTANYPI
jgi:DNA adenine methylase